MKSFISFPFELDMSVNSRPTAEKSSGKLIAHYDLFKKVRHINGAVVKCGISAEEDFTRFAMFRALVNSHLQHKMVAFQKHYTFFEEDFDASGQPILTVKKKSSESTINNLEKVLVESGQHNNIEFVPGDINDAIPQYIIANPELKIAMLNIDLDDYEGTTNSLEFFYPRLVHGGILILDNYYKNLAERKAVDDYFRIAGKKINNFSISKGPHYIINTH